MSVLCRFRQICLAGLPALALSACDPPPAKDAPGFVREFKAEPPEPRRAEQSSPEALRWLRAWESVREQKKELEEELKKAQKIFDENDFDAILARDPAELDAERLCSLYHLLTRGFFHVEREALLRFLEARARRGPLPEPDAATRLSGRIQTALYKDEWWVVDLESILEVYRKTGDEPIPIPEDLTEEETEELRAEVARLMEKERRLIAELDAKIDALQVR